MNWSRNSRRSRRGALAAALAFAAACSGPAGFRAEPWPAAERLFRSEPDWRGGDAAYAIPLGGEGAAARTLWLFGDSFVARAPGATQRAGTAMVRNSIAVQNGDDPATARMEFASRRDANGPADFFPGDGGEWFWPLHGLRIGEAVVVFGARIARDETPKSLGFRVVGWTAFLVRGVDGPPAAWALARLPVPACPFPTVVGTAVVADAEHVYAYALREPGDHAVFLLRWPRERVAQGDLLGPEWRDGERWVAHRELRLAPRPVLAEGAPEFAVLRDGAAFAMVQTLGFPTGDLVVRTAPAPWGPWSEPLRLLHPPQSDRQGLLVYAGKATPLADGSWLATYASNAFDFGTLVRDESLYYPHCVRIRR
ncbi:MAG: hypothetical protein U1E73_04730 [Planctomycetota bacterium]